eukprot:comp19381_c0_seq1/m.22360 comp19381_c0_seq1/g.22360  ORF comp19381_c0_seq1/g.22360 comp19381_c0_seq1/m.22360 type:complete len:260 (-) comp19381_c0_seq1:166-945(-)
MASSDFIPVPVQPEVHVFANRHGIHLAALLDRKTPESKKVVVLCHGLMSHKRGSVVGKLAPNLPFNTFRFDFSGNGESEGEFTYGAYQGEAEDLADVVGYLTGLGLSVVAVVGHSKGAAVALLYGMQHHQVPYLVSIASRYDHTKTPASRFTPQQQEDLRTQGYTYTNGGGGRQFRITQSGIDERLRVDMSGASRISSKVLLVHGTADETIPCSEVHVFASLIPSNEVRLVEGANHSFTEQNMWMSLCRVVQDWMHDKM